MEIQGFISLFEGYWPYAKNYKAPKQQDLWAEIIDGIPDDLIQYALKRYARTKKNPPTVLDMEQWLWPLMDSWAARNPASGLGADWIRRRAAWKAEQDEADLKPPIERPCEVCEAVIRWSDDVPPKRFDVDGGMLYKPVPDPDREGEWFALRCPACSGPGRHWPQPKGNSLLARYGSPGALPVPPREQFAAGEWVPLSKTPGGPLWDTVLAERIMTRADPRFLECFRWQRRAVKNSRAKIVAAITAEQEAWEAEQRAERMARLEAKIRERDGGDAAATEPEHIQHALALALEPAPDDAPEPGADLDVPDFGPDPDSGEFDDPGPDDTPPF